MKKYSDRASEALESARGHALDLRNEFVTPEHLLWILLDNPALAKALGSLELAQSIREDLDVYLDELDTVPEGIDYEPEQSFQLQSMLGEVEESAEESSAREIDIPHIVNALVDLPESQGAFLLRGAVSDSRGDFMLRVIDSYRADGEDDGPALGNSADWEPLPFDGGSTDPSSGSWRRLVTCLNDHYAGRNPLVGREEELRRTVQVLCRKDKNNPLHVGEPGVGKTALVWGLARRIEEGDVPARLKGSRIYMMDMTTLIAGTQYRGDFEQRIKSVLDGVMAESDNNIIYIDEIHMLVGAGATGNDAMDASNILKPYLEGGTLRFIGSTTYEEFNRQFAKSKGLMRRFRKIDIEEPSPAEARHILEQLQPRYEEYHGVRYAPEAIAFAVEASARHISDRFLPDKAIDLIDEAGAAMQLAEEKGEVGVKEVADALAKACKVDALAVAEKDDFERLQDLSDRMRARIYGQDEAIRLVAESVQMARAGLLDAEKPLASMLFVGPTGVGKTEVARTLARELGVELVRFDMSEYQEKHSVAKLIGAPAGYVGYDDGGLLTDAVRKSPSCVLLLDEIEKAHQDIYNILLQVMDYGRLTDNKGRHADFRNVVLLMTSNAGARHAAQAMVGFASTATRGGAMMREVKRVFRPEFLNRLSATVVFNDMDRHMASLILQRKLGELRRKLEDRNVALELSDAAFSLLLEEGFLPEYGAREMDRVIRQRLNPLLMREILFGFLRSGGRAMVDSEGGNLAITPAPLLPAP